MKNVKSPSSRLLLCLLCLLCGAAALIIYLPDRVYTAEHFGIATVQSAQDADGDGIDDYTDMMLAARERILSAPEYKSAYYAGGYPPEGEGVCTDVIWMAFKAAGYDLKSMVDADIADRRDAYPHITHPDPNIDFRRVRNLRIFFDTYAISLSCDVRDIEQFQPGDIVIYEGHVGMVSDKRNRRGVPFIIHHGSGTGAEENALAREPIIGHYRWPDE